MMSKTRATVIFLAVAAMLLVGSPAHALGWTTVPSPNEVPGDNRLYGADSSDASNVWAVGGVLPPRSGTSHGLVFRYDGVAWRSVSRTGLPGDEALRGVDAVSATDVWVVGDRPAGFAARRDRGGPLERDDVDAGTHTERQPRRLQQPLRRRSGGRHGVGGRRVCRPELVGQPAQADPPARRRQLARLRRTDSGGVRASHGR